MKDQISDIADAYKDGYEYGLKMGEEYVRIESNIKRTIWFWKIGSFTLYMLAGIGISNILRKVFQWAS